MATASVTNTFVNGQSADADDVNTNFTDLVSFLNASVVHADGAIAMSGDLDMGDNGLINVASLEGHAGYTEFIPTTGARFLIDPFNATGGSGSYPWGLSFMSVSATESGWPTSAGLVMTVKQAEGGGTRLFQLFFSKTLGPTNNVVFARSRNTDDTAWTDFYRFTLTS